MNSITFEVIDSSKNTHKISTTADSPKLEIDDNLVNSLCEQLGISQITHFSVGVGANNMAIIIKDYTITQAIRIFSFYNSDSHISMLQTIDVNLEVVGQHIKHLQVDCKKLQLVNCSVDKIDIGLFKKFEPKKDKQNIELFKMELLDLRDSEIKTLDLFAKCTRIDIQRTRLAEMMFYSGMFSRDAKIKELHIWYNSNIDKLTISNNIEKLKIDTSRISRLYAHSTLKIGTLETKDAVVESCYGFNQSIFSTPSYDSWSWISKSAQNSLDTQLKADATYEMLKCSYRAEKKSDLFFGKLFDFCAGYGYKPFRIIRASALIILLNTIIYSVIELLTILSQHSIPLNCTSLWKAICHVWDNLLMSVASFIGQGALTSADGIAYWFSTFEYLSGIILFAMFVNALYLRYKE